MRLPTAAALSALVLSLALATSAGAQQASRTRKPAEGPPRTIVIRGVLPTPQVVTVRPREVPEFDRGVFVPNYFDRHFRQALAAPTALTTREALTLATHPGADPRLKPHAPAAAQPQE